jgi:enoyl-CoA hydratase/carnithine racemase
MAPYQFIQYSVSEHIARVTLNRPPVNALNKDLVAELIGLAKELKPRDDVWLIAVHANGRAFCAGADLKERKNIPADQVIGVVEGIQAVVSSWCELPQPVIMCVQGPALGGGLEFVLSGDLIVAGESATFGLPETGLGIIPAAGGTQRLAQRTSMGVAKKWILTARHFSAQEALRDGVIDFLVPADTFIDDSEQIIRSVASNAPLALRQAKRAIESSYTDWLLDGLNHELTLYRPLIATEDRTEALAAFNEKRKPNWKSK